MKVFFKKIVLFFVFFVQLIATAQIVMTKIDGSPVNDGDVFLFNANAGNAAYLNFKVYNTSNLPTNVKIKCISITNSNGSDVQLCFGDVCYANISAGNSYPNVAYFLDANGENGNFDHFYNNSNGLNPMQNVEFMFKMYQLDNNGVEFGNSITFGYRYNPNLSVANLSPDGLKNFGVSMASNSVQNQLEIDIAAPMTVRIFDLNGRILSTQKLAIGQQNLDVAAQSAGLYMIHFTNEAGQNVVAKWMKK